MAWRNLTLTVGLVNIPVGIDPVISDSGVSGSFVCATSKEKLSGGASKKSCGHTHDGDCEQVIGYEVDGVYVVPSAEQLASLDDEKDGAVRLDTFVDNGDVDPVYYEKSYLVTPGKGDNRGFWLIANALRDNNRAAVGRVVLTKKERMVVVRWSEALQALLFHTCHFDAQIKREKIAAVVRPEINFNEAEVDLAKKLVTEIFTTAFDPAAVTDERTAKLSALIADLAAGNTPTVAPAAPKASAMDLTAALEAMVKGA
jgi:DNA end-binding protein Ku